ncbi:TolC family protein [Chryseobacterium sp. Bi04]|uniref:TolC family protein n=1 Tax=Chryseobacterium sp. Bi04 TaxID=2822345 RepID=UPI001D8FDC2B|nr:TolC family protein [Chryseobacterium sp. Bi04]CAH0211992.1 hypothetical protein SRABI04_02249 [Chryseobacterium sp. Bi04]
MKPIQLINAGWAVLFFLFFLPIDAQVSDSIQVLRLEEIWKIAESGNRQIKLTDLEQKESSISILEAKDKLLPELSVAGDFKLNSKFLIYDNGLFSTPQNVPASRYGYAAGYNFSLNIYNGGREQRNIRIKEEERIHRQHESELQKNTVKYAIAVAYYDLSKFLQFRDLLSSEMINEKKQLSKIESLHRNGIVLKSDVLRTSLKLSQLELSFSDVEKKIEVARQRLNILMGRKGDQALEIPYQEILSHSDIMETDYSDYVAIALSKSPEIKITQSNLRLSELNIKQVKASLLPRISLYSYYNYTYPQVSFFPYSNDVWGYGQTGVKMQFSIDNLYKSKHSIAHANNINLQQQEKSNIKKDEINIQVKEAFLQKKQAEESVETAEKNIIQSTETTRVIRNSYLNQESLLTDLLDAENTLLEAKFTLTSAHMALKLSAIRLLIITGIFEY